MTIPEQTDAFYTDLYQLISRYSNEFDLPLETIIGAIEMVKADLVSGVAFQVDFEIDTEEDE